LLKKETCITKLYGLYKWLALTSQIEQLILVVRLSLPRKSLLKSAGLAVVLVAIVTAAFLQVPSITSPQYREAGLVQVTSITVTSTVTRMVTTPIPTPAPTPPTPALKAAVEEVKWPVRIISLTISAPGAEIQSVSDLKVGETYHITATVVRDRHNDDGSDSYVFIVQVNDVNGISIAQSRMMGILPVGSESSLTLWWTPSAAGKYTVQASVWCELRGYPLAEAKEMQVQVSP
jgi:hypothetical protein